MAAKIPATVQGDRSAPPGSANHRLSISGMASSVQRPSHGLRGPSKSTVAPSTGPAKATVNPEMMPTWAIIAWPFTASPTTSVAK